MELVRCSNRLCDKEFSNEFTKCPFCGTPVTEKNTRLSIEDPHYAQSEEKANWEPDYGIISDLKKFLNYYKGLPKKKAYLFLGLEFVIGIIVFLLGGFLSMVGPTSEYRGNTVGAFAFLIGGVVFFHSIYSLIKCVTSDFLHRNGHVCSEFKARLVTLCMDIICGIILIIPAAPYEYFGKKDPSDFVYVLFGIGWILIAVSILSFLRYLFNVLCKTIMKKKRSL